MLAKRIVEVMVFSIIPVVELRWAIPYGIAKLGLHPVVALASAVIASWAVIVPMFLIMDLFYATLLSRFAPIRRVVEEIRTGGRRYVERWGVLGVGIYVSLPLPGPGIYSGAVLAWLFGLPRRQAIIALALGVLVSAVLVTMISTGVIAIIRKFV
ncbi:MAG TPA: small multi-drug export protein [bacterium]|nr:small multi-drug export protein [bacterium]